MTDYLDSQEFYELMYAYRWADTAYPKAVTAAFEAVKAYIRAQSKQDGPEDNLARACNLAGLPYETFLRIKAYLPVETTVVTTPREVLK